MIKYFVIVLIMFYNFLDNDNKRFNHEKDFLLHNATANARVICDERLRVMTSRSSGHLRGTSEDDDKK